MSQRHADDTGYVRLAAVHNFRDVAGGGYRLADGGVMTRGLVYRSPVLTCTEDDQQVLRALDVRRVVDLRTDEEVAKQPDLLPDGVEYVPVDVLAGHVSAVTALNAHAHDADSAREEMATTYEAFVRGERERRAFGSALRAVATSPGATIIHCTAGKDRTGWLAAVLQSLAGVGDDDLMADYLRTNELSTEFVEAVCGYVEQEMPDQLEVMRVLLRVEAQYLDRALAAMRADFGDVRNYLVDGAGLDAALVDGLAGRLADGRRPR